MKIALIHIKIAGTVLAVLISQWACGAGAQPANVAPSDSGAQATQAPPATSGERGTPEEAQALLQLAIDHYNQVGPEQAHADFNSGQPPYKDRDLYVACMTQNHIETVNGGFPQVVGQSADSVISSNGQPVGQASWDAAASGGVGSVDYQWLNPLTGQTEPKRLFVEKVGDEVCGVGVYNP